ncbi:MoaD/ThiS family protein [Candidatus Poriferisodalis sp.]|uniref:MoaD/ThiS family protein n=1 Tax=Candidatus Poriferisodalis sp. TaxID=3101277 RepID=UPI003AF78A7A
MAVVHFSTDQRKHTDLAEVTIEAANVRDLVRQLSELYPSLNAHLVETSSTAVAIDGEIIPDPMLEALTETSEVHLVRPLAGG